MTIDLNQTVQAIEHLLLQEQSQPIQSRSDIGASELRRKEAQKQIAVVSSEAQRLQREFNRLPRLSEPELMDWAEAVLATSNMAIVVLDTTSLSENADIIRVTALDFRGNALIDQVIQPQREIGPNTAYTGITEEQIEQAPTIEQAWPHILDLKGRFFVSFNLEFVEMRLKNAIAHYGLQRLPFLGDDLMERARAYFGVTGYNGLKLSDAVARIGKPFPYRPPLARDRALGCLNLLMAMSQGVTSAKSSITDTDLDELDSNPF